MKYIVCILLIAILSGCSLSTGSTAKRICSGVGQCCATLCISPRQTPELTTNGLIPTENAIPVISLSLTERTGKLLTW
ncbi:hypothetical protein [Sediminibacterium soli]|uniref:hypothetical protein n=1 Tax=Sediminibacterium soli TaxID=2698829 RepID=UPI001379A6A2|nr:hypothetical protein [Sediminibacterium soli]NCI46623.1 hypothetical protein [Sediminibacterium soli]